jgi:hypothetical protein
MDFYSELFSFRRFSCPPLPYHPHVVVIGFLATMLPKAMNDDFVKQSRKPVSKTKSDRMMEAE